MAQFEGACHVYIGLVRPALSNLQAVVDNLSHKLMEEKPYKKETFLDVAEEYIKENGCEALEKLIASKQEHKEFKKSTEVLEPEEKIAAGTSKQKEPDASQHDNEMLEATEKRVVSTEVKQKEPDASQHDNEMLEATEKRVVSIGVKQVQYAESTVAAWVPKGPDAAVRVPKETDAAVWAPKGTNAAAMIKELIPPEASSKNEHPLTPPPPAKVHVEWTCHLCNVSTTCEKLLNDHLLGGKHKSKCESLRTSKLQQSSKVGEVSQQKTQERVQFQVQYAQSTVSAWVPKGTDAAVRVPKETDDAVCVPKEMDAAVSVPKGTDAAVWAPKGTNTAAIIKELIPPEASSKNEHPPTLPPAKVHVEWTCHLCNVSTTCEKLLNDHLLGGEHKSTCESQRTSKLQQSSRVGEVSQQKIQERVQFQVQYAQSTVSAWVPKGTDAAVRVPKEKDAAVCVPKEMDAAVSVPKGTDAAAGVPKGTYAAVGILKGTDAAVWAPKGTNAAAIIKELIPPEASSKNEHAPTPPPAKVDVEWTCHLCNVSTTCEKLLNDHLLGGRHKSKCESLRTSKLQQSSRVGEVSHQKTRERVRFQVQKEAKPKQEGGANQIFKLHCNVCNVKLISDVDLASHLNGKRHFSNMEALLQNSGWE